MKIRLAIIFLFINFAIQAQETFTVYFDLDIDEVNTPSVKSLDEWVSQNRNAEIIKVYGYADTVGTNSYNIALSKRRAADVISKLRKGGITITGEITTEGFGEDFETSLNQAENRKAVIYYNIPQPVTAEVKKEISDFRKAVVNAKKGDVLRVPNLNFLNNSDILLPESRPVLVELFNILKENPKLKIDIQGHICCQPGELDKVSEKRAVAIYRTLIKNGIDQNRLTWQSFGSSRPIYPLPEKSEEERKANRRVEIKIIDN